MSSLPSSEEAAAEVMRRRIGRGSLVDYARAIEIPGAPVSEAEDEDRFNPVETDLAAHHVLLLRAIERAAATRYGRFMAFMPPGSAKSTYTSVVAPTYFMGKRPGTRIILASYGTDLARKHGRRARQVARSSGYRAIWRGTTITRDSSAANEWSLTNGSEYLAAGLRAGLTGNRAHGALVDDPIKGREAADSKVIRDATWDAYVDDLSTRLIPGGWMGIIQTRWHEDDLAGRLLPKGYNGESGLIKCNDGRLWDIINLPAQCERDDDPLGRRPGDMLWPEWFDPDYWTAFRTSPRTWAALCQQRPRPEEGGIFKNAWCLQRWGSIPRHADRVVHSWDTASKEQQINDPTACAVFRTGDGVPGHYLQQVHVDRIDYPTLKQRVINFAERDLPSAILIEDKSSGQALIQELRRTTRLPVIAIEPVQSKLFRAMDVSEMVESGLLLLPASAPWLLDFELEFFGFPVTTHDDQVDAVTQYLKWARSWTGRLESAGAGMTRAHVEAHRHSADDGGGGSGYGSVSRSESMEGFL